APEGETARQEQVTVEYLTRPEQELEEVAMGGDDVLEEVPEEVEQADVLSLEELELEDSPGWLLEEEVQGPELEEEGGTKEQAPETPRSTVWQRKLISRPQYGAYTSS
ncbi:MAG: hypothetical protein ACRDC4_06505, partial [Plesiomonas sp.]